MAEHFVKYILFANKKKSDLSQQLELDNV